MTSQYVPFDGVILAAGKGQRLLSEYSSILPKPLIPVNDKPILYYVFRNLMALGIKNYYVVINHKGNLVKEYVKSNFSELDVKFIEQSSLSGIADAISLAKPYLGARPFVVHLGDEIDQIKNLSWIINKFISQKPVVVTGKILENNLDIIKRTCSIVTDATDKIEIIEEKPLTPKSKFRGIGVYVFDSRIFDLIARTPISKVRNEREITDTIGIAAKFSEAFAVTVYGHSFNVNTRLELDIARRTLNVNSLDQDIGLSNIE